jgi:hypothetical protein
MVMSELARPATRKRIKNLLIDGHPSQIRRDVKWGLLPAGATCAFNVTEEAYPQLSPVTVTINTPAGMSTGNYPLQFVVSSGGQSATATASLDLFAFNLQAPAAASDWSTPASSPTVVFPVQVSSNLPAGSLQIVCTLDSITACQPVTTVLQPTATSVSVTLSVPQNVAQGQHQLSLTTTLYGNTQTFTFPYTIADFTGTLNASTLSMQAGSTATLTATLNATVGFSDNVTFACSAPAEIKCTVPAPTQLTNAAAQNVSVSLYAEASAAKLHRRRLPAPLLPGSGPLALAGAFPILIGVIFRRRRWGAFFQLIICFCVISLVASCGSGRGSATGGGGGDSGSYTVSISATAAGTNDTHNLGSVVVTVTQ